MSYFEGKVALVTGGASGIGYSVGKKLLDNGIKGIGIVDISDEDLKKVEKELQSEYFNKILLIRADVTKKQELEDAFEKTICKFNNLDIVMNNAGISNEVEWEKTVAVNLEAVMRGTYLAKDKYLPKYISGNEGIIVNTASILGLDVLGNAPTYCITKHGVIGLGKALAVEKCSGPRKIKVITICPGVVNTPLLNRIVVFDAAGYEEALAQLLEKVSSPEYIAESVADIIQKGEHGSVWVMENELTPYEVKFPSRLELKK